MYICKSIINNKLDLNQETLLYYTMHFCFRTARAWHTCSYFNLALSNEVCGRVLIHTPNTGRKYNKSYALKFFYRIGPRTVVPFATVGNRSEKCFD